MKGNRIGTTTLPCNKPDTDCINVHNDNVCKNIDKNPKQKHGQAEDVPPKHFCFVTAIIRGDWQRAGYSDAQIDKIECENNGNLLQYHSDFVKICPENPPEKDSDEEEEILPDTNPPKNASKAESSLTMTQMQHPTTNDQPDWSILSETISYHSCPSNELDISPAEALDPPPPQDPTTPDPEDAPFFTPYEGVHCELHDPSMYDDLSDVSTTYLGPIEYDQHKPFFKEATVSIDPRCVGKATLPNR